MKPAFTPRTFTRAFDFEGRNSEFAEFLNSTTLSDPAEAVLERASRFVWRNGDDVESAIQAYTRRLDALRYRYDTIDNYDLEGSSRAMAAFALTAMMDGKGCGWATWYLRHEHLHVLDAIRNHGRSLIRSADAASWNSLPETFTIYRGTLYAGENKIIKGTAWTIDIEIARRFGTNSVCGGERGYKNNTGAVYALSISKTDVLYYSNEREENEIILAPAFRGREAYLYEKTKQKDIEAATSKPQESLSFLNNLTPVPYSGDFDFKKLLTL